MVMKVNTTKTQNPQNYNSFLRLLRFSGHIIALKVLILLRVQIAYQ
jgi:hypothetical protein